MKLSKVNRERADRYIAWLAIMEKQAGVYRSITKCKGLGVYTCYYK